MGFITPNMLNLTQKIICDDIYVFGDNNPSGTDF